MTTPKDDSGRLVAVMDALAAHAETASDREILEDAVAAGVDVRVEASRIRDVLVDAVLRTKKQRLHNATEAHAQKVAALDARAARLPETPVARKALLERTVRRRPEIKQMVITLQHRDFEAFSDRDVESALRQLDALGLINNDPASDE
jgi:hypothetical protein